MAKRKEQASFTYDVKPRVVMFDLDGTLVDTMSEFAGLAADMMAKHQRLDVKKSRTQYLETSGIPFAEQLELIIPGNPLNGATADEFELRKRRICDTTPMSRDTVDALCKLRRRGLKLMVSSNTGQELVDHFEDRESFEFDLALGLDPVEGLSKGLPHLRLGMETFKVKTQELWFVGDSLKDGEIALRAGIPFVGKLGTFQLKDFNRHFGKVRTIRTIADLCAMV